MDRANRKMLALKESRFVARERELATLLSALDSAAAAQSRLVMLAGEPGVGKTRLARELLDHAERRAYHCVVGRCFEQYASLPFGMLLEALPDALDFTSPALRSEVPRRWPELAPLLPDAVEPDVRSEGEDGPGSASWSSVRRAA